MHPIERLRHVARSSGEPAELAEEAASALQALSGDPRALLTASRRLLDAHPECGPMWWLAARLLCAMDPEAAAQQSQDQLAADVTAEELAAALPASSVIVTAASPLTVLALSLRPDCAVRLVGSPASLRRSMRALAGAVSEVVGYTPAETRAALGDATLLLVEVLAASGSGALVPAGSGRLIEQAGRLGVPVWLVCGEGRALPASLFEACASCALAPRRRPADSATSSPWGAPPPSPAIERVPVDAVAVAVTPHGPATLSDAFAHPGCPAPPELTRLAG